ncbi:MAG: ABC transporter permease subunit [Rhizobiales bacterium]|nr:ABC transporter permease subunit [Hyphomicrobiales bacterium]
MTARLAWLLLVVFNLVTIAVLLVPLVVSVLVSFNPSEHIGIPDTFSLKWYREFFGDWQWTDALRSSLYVAFLTIVISLPVGMLAAIAFTRYGLKWAGALNLAIMLPLFIPPVVIGLGSLTFHRWIGIWGTHFSVAAAHALWAIPLVFVVLRTTLKGVDRSLEEAAAGLGASPLVVFREVTLPLTATGVLVGALFAFIISINEFIMALFLGTAEVKTLPVAIWPKIRYLLTPIVAAASSVIIVITVLLLVICARLMNIRRLVEMK